MFGTLVSQYSLDTQGYNLKLSIVILCLHCPQLVASLFLGVCGI